MGNVIALACRMYHGSWRPKRQTPPARAALPNFLPPGFKTAFEPEMRVLSVLEVDGKAWLFNELSHVQERPDRTDVDVLDPHTVRIVDAFNLESPFPAWSERTDEETICIFHQVSFTGL